MATTEDRYISLLTDSPKDESQWYAYGYHSGDDRTVCILTSLMAMLGICAGDRSWRREDTG